MMNFIWLLFAHYIGDSALQSQWQAKYKRKFCYVRFCHCMIWTGIVSIALEYLGIFSLWKVFFLVLGHYACDTWKCSKPRVEESPRYMYYDHAIHLAQLLIVYFLK